MLFQQTLLQQAITPLPSTLIAKVPTTFPSSLPLVVEATTYYSNIISTNNKSNME